MSERSAPRARLTDPRARLVAEIVLAAVSVIEALTRRGLEHSPLAVALVVAITGPVLVRRSHPLAAIGAEVILFLLVAVAGFADKFPPDTLAVFPAVVAYSCGAHADRRTGVVGAVSLYAAMQISVGFSEFPNAELALLAGGPWGAGRQVRGRRRLVDELSARTRELEEAEEAFVALSVRRERARIARELHDVVSHHLAVMVIQAGAGRLAGEVPAEQAAERLGTIRDAGQQALADMARLVDLLQADAYTPGAHLAEVLERARAGAVDLRVVTRPADLVLPPAVEEDTCRVVQEGLTNAMKHAPGARLHLLLEVYENEVLVELRNDAIAGVSVLAATGSGLGLGGMRERIQALHGSLDVGPDDAGGWCLRARLPVEV